MIGGNALSYPTFLMMILVQNFMLIKNDGSQNPSFFPVDCGYISSYCSYWQENNFDISLRVVILPLKRETEIKTAQFIYRFQALNLNSIEYSRFTNCYGIADEKRISWHRET